VAYINQPKVHLPKGHHVATTINFHMNRKTCWVQ
jgi:hypothetical protein